jgi:hypothetical protein
VSSDWSHSAPSTHDRANIRPLRSPRIRRRPIRARDGPEIAGSRPTLFSTTRRRLLGLTPRQMSLLRPHAECSSRLAGSQRDAPRDRYGRPSAPLRHLLCNLTRCAVRSAHQAQRGSGPPQRHPRRHRRRHIRDVTRRHVAEHEADTGDATSIDFSAANAETVRVVGHQAGRLGR